MYVHMPCIFLLSSPSIDITRSPPTSIILDLPIFSLIFLATIIILSPLLLLLQSYNPLQMSFIYGFCITSSYSRILIVIYRLTKIMFYFFLIIPLGLYIFPLYPLCLIKQFHLFHFIFLSISLTALDESDVLVLLVIESKQCD